MSAEQFLSLLVPSLRSALPAPDPAADLITWATFALIMHAHVNTVSNAITQPTYIHTHTKALTHARARLQRAQCVCVILHTCWARLFVAWPFSTWVCELVILWMFLCVCVSVRLWAWRDELNFPAQIMTSLNLNLLWVSLLRWKI